MGKPTLLILTPLFPPATGGAGTYYNLLSRELISRGSVERIVILTEQVPGIEEKVSLHGGKLVILRRFPYRAGATREGRLKYGVQLAYQNLLYFELGRIIRKFGITTVLVHSGFQNVPNLLTAAILWLRRRMNLFWVGDVRDHQMPARLLIQLRVYDRIVACSENVRQHICQSDHLSKRCVHIPVIQEAIETPGVEAVEELLQKHGLRGLKFISYVGLIKERKGVSLLLDSFEELRKRDPNLHLVLAGILKADQALSQRLKSAKMVHYLGAVPRKDAIAIMSRSLASISLSSSEGMPRACLEALSLGIRVGLPRGIPEFEKWCPDSVIGDSDPASIANRLIKVMASSAENRYPIADHYPENVIPAYEKLLRDRSG